MIHTYTSVSAWTHYAHARDQLVVTENEMNSSLLLSNVLNAKKMLNCYSEKSCPVCLSAIAKASPVSRYSI